MDESGAMLGYVCIQCDHRQRRKRMGWQRRLKAGLRHLFRI
jgi:hypothetical protein